MLTKSMPYPLQLNKQHTFTDFDNLKINLIKKILAFLWILTMFPSITLLYIISFFYHIIFLSTFIVLCSFVRRSMSWRKQQAMQIKFFKRSRNKKIAGQHGILNELRKYGGQSLIQQHTSFIWKIIYKHGIP